MGDCAVPDVAGNTAETGLVPSRLSELAMAPQALTELETYLGPSVHRLLSRVKPEQTLLIRRGHIPEVVRRPNYLRDPALAGTFAPNPFYSPYVGDDLEEVRSAPPPDNVVRFPDGAGR